MEKLSSILSLIYVNLSSLVSLVVSYYVKLKHKNLLYYLTTTKEQKSSNRSKVDTSTPKRQLNKVSMKAALKEKKDIVKAYDEQKDRSLKKVKNRNAGLE